MPFEQNEPLLRKRWVTRSLLEKREESFWLPYTGNTKDAIIYQVKDEGAESGKTVVFDYKGFQVGRFFRGLEPAYGRSTQVPRFNDTVILNLYRVAVNNGIRFEEAQIGDVLQSMRMRGQNAMMPKSYINHTNSLSTLMSSFYRMKDQFIFDELQGLTRGKAPTHILSFTSGFGLDSLDQIERSVKMSDGFSTGERRLPLIPYRFVNASPCWLLVVDAEVASMLRRDPDYRTVLSQADYRGSENRTIKGIIGKLGSLMIVEAPVFFGTTRTLSVISGSDVTISGLRQRDAAGNWTGETDFNSSTQLTSRCLLLGASAISSAFGKMPEYLYQLSEDFGIGSESALESWFEIQKTKLSVTRGDYPDAPLNNIDFGVIAVDVRV